MFVEKLNKKQDGVYVIEEEKSIINGKWEGVLDHDNVFHKTISIYTGPKLTGEKVDNYFISTPSETPWKTHLKVFYDSENIYISYETTGDQVEADDINVLQDVLVDEITRSKETDKDLNTKVDVEIARSTKAESVLSTNLSNEVARAKGAESNLDIKINSEISRATSKENLIENNLGNEIIRSTNKENAIESNLNSYKSSNNAEIQKLKEKDTALETNKAEKTYVDTELLKKADKINTYTKQEVLAEIEKVIDAAPDALNTLKEIAVALNNDPNFAATITSEISKKVDKVTGKGLSDENYTLPEKQKLAGIEVNANSYTHPANHPASMITESTTKRFVTDTEKTNWNAKETPLGAQSKADNAEASAKAYIDLHDGNTIKHITTTERTNWNDANNKKHEHSNKTVLDKITQALLDNWNSSVAHVIDAIKHITSTERTLWNTVSSKADKSQVLTNVPANAKFTDTVYTHPDTASIRHVTDTEKSTWNGKVEKAYVDTNFATKAEIGQAGYGDMLKSVYDTNNNGKVDKAEVADSVGWTGVTGKPSTFPPNSHTHDTLSVKIDNYKDGNSLPSTYDRGQTVFFSNTPANKFNGIPYCTVHTIKGYSNMAAMQFIYPYNVDMSICYRYALYNSDTWREWKELATKGPLTWNDLKGV